MAPLSVLTAPLGARVAHGVSKRTLEIGFGCFLLAESSSFLATSLDYFNPDQDSSGAEKLGISPKNLATVVRFKQYYNAVAHNNELSFMKNDFYDLYYDQSHFMKEFRRFTGLSYSGFENKTNDFGKLFYKE